MTSDALRFQVVKGMGAHTYHIELKIFFIEFYESHTPETQVYTQHFVGAHSAGYWAQRISKLSQKYMRRIIRPRIFLFATSAIASKSRWRPMH